MDTLFSLKVFRQVVQSGSFTRAADQLEISTAMASKHVSHLENTIQAKLLHRNNRNLHLTEAGEEYYRQCSYALDTLDTAAQKVAGGAASSSAKGKQNVNSIIKMSNTLRYTFILLFLLIYC